jgi:hypothetical protein
MSVAEFRNLGEEIGKRSSYNYSTETRRFKALFRMSVNICSMVWNVLSDNDSHTNGAKPIQLLCTLFMKQKKCIQLS